MIHDLQHRLNCPGLGVIRTVDQTLDPGMNERARAHRARFHGGKQFAVAQTMVAEVRTGIAQGNDLGMGRRIAFGEIAIPSPANHLTVTNHHRSHGNFTDFQSTLSAAERFLHQEFVGDLSRRLVADPRSLAVRHRS
jgi:hypothetical protein